MDAVLRPSAWSLTPLEAATKSPRRVHSEPYRCPWGHGPLRAGTRVPLSSDLCVVGSAGKGVRAVPSTLALPTPEDTAYSTYASHAAYCANQTATATVPSVLSPTPPPEGVAVDVERAAEGAPLARPSAAPPRTQSCCPPARYCDLKRRASADAPRASRGRAASTEVAVSRAEQVAPSAAP
eukprot:3637174-Prymnesium_polylepis.1